MGVFLNVLENFISTIQLTQVLAIPTADDFSTFYTSKLFLINYWVTNVGVMKNAANNLINKMVWLKRR